MDRAIKEGFVLFSKYILCKSSLFFSRFLPFSLSIHKKTSEDLIIKHTAWTFTSLKNTFPISVPIFQRN